MQHRPCPILIRDVQDRAMKTDMYIVRETGPTAWNVAERGGKSFRVRLGDKHSCDCPGFKTTGDLCIHISWAIIKKLGLKPNDPLSYQLGMSDRQLNDCMVPKQIIKPIIKHSTGLHQVKKRLIKKDDPCPICLEAFESKRSPVVYCKYSCGQGVHGHCMEIVAKHQENPERLSCPLCRGHFSSLAELRSAMRFKINKPLPELPKHDVDCTFCQHKVIGCLYKCLTCPQVLLCSLCLKSVNYKMHSRHGVAVKKSPSEKWKLSTISQSSPNIEETKNQMPKPSIYGRRKKFIAPGAFFEDQPPRPKCPICTDLDSAVVTLECGHLVTTPELEGRKQEATTEKKNPRISKCRWSSGSSQSISPSLIPPPEVMVQRLELYKREPPPPTPSTHSKRIQMPRQRKKKEPGKRNSPEPDIRENGRLLGSKVLPIMAMLLQRQSEEEEEEEKCENEEIEPVQEEKKTGKRKLTIQCVQLLPDAESSPRPKTSYTRPWKMDTKKY